MNKITRLDIICEDTEKIFPRMLGILETKTTRKNQKKYHYESIKSKKRVEPSHLGIIQEYQEENREIEIVYHTKEDVKNNQKLNQKIKTWAQRERRKSIFIEGLLLVLPFLLFLKNSNLLIGLFKTGICLYCNMSMYFRLENIYQGLKMISVKEKINPHLIGICGYILSALTPLLGYQTWIEETIESYESFSTTDSFNPEKKTEEEVQNAIETLHKTLQENPNISEKEYDYILTLDTYLEENPYTNYDELNAFYENLNIETSQNIPGFTGGKFYRNQSYIEIEDTLQSDELYHELTHLTGFSPFHFLREGIATLITTEYAPMERKVVETEEYYQSFLFTRMLVTLVGRDIVLQSYVEENMSVINQRLLEIVPNRVTLQNLYRCLIQVDQRFDKISEYNCVENIDEEKMQKLYQKQYEALQETCQALEPYETIVQEEFLKEGRIEEWVSGYELSKYALKESIQGRYPKQSLEKCLKLK